MWSSRTLQIIMDQVRDQCWALSPTYWCYASNIAASRAKAPRHDPHLWTSTLQHQYIREQLRTPSQNIKVAAVPKRHTIFYAIDDRPPLATMVNKILFWTAFGQYFPTTIKIQLGLHHARGRNWVLNYLCRAWNAFLATRSWDATILQQGITMGLAALWWNRSKLRILVSGCGG